MERGSRVVRALMAHGLQALKPPPVAEGGRWVKPVLSKQKFARLRKTVLRSGGEWPSEWELPKRAFRQRPEPKGHKVDRHAQIKRQSIEEAMEKMPKLVAEYRQSKVKTSSPLDDIVLTAKQKAIKRRGAVR